MSDDNMNEQELRERLRAVTGTVEDAPSASPDFTVSVKRRKPHVVHFLVGGFTSEGVEDPHVYEFTVPKSSVMMAPMITGSGGEDNEILQMQLTRGMFSWLGAGLSDDDNHRLTARLTDPDDDVDMSDLQGVVSMIQEQIGRRPST